MKLAGVCLSIFLPCLAIAQRTVEPAEAFLSWVSRNAKRLDRLESGKDFSDLRAVRRMVDGASMIALGETHGTHELLELRNRFFQYLVEEMDCGAIAVESGVTEAMLADDFVMGLDVDNKMAARSVFSNNRTTAYAENLELIDWMRRYNAAVPLGRKIRLYGLDMPGQINGDFVESRIALDAVLRYLDRIDAEVGVQFRKRLDPFLSKFHMSFGTPRTADYRTLTEAERDTLTATITDLVSLFERHRIDFIARSSERDYIAGYRNAVAARQLDNHFRVRPEGRSGNPLDFAEASTARDTAMAENALWVLHHGGARSRVFVYAGMGHVHRGFQKPDSRFFPSKPPLWMGQYLYAQLGNSLYVFGTAFRQADEKLNVGTIDPASVDGILARVSLAPFAINLRAVPDGSSLATWLNGTESQTGYDGFITVDRISPAHVIP